MAVNSFLSEDENTFGRDVLRRDTFRSRAAENWAAAAGSTSAIAGAPLQPRPNFSLILQIRAKRFCQSPWTYSVA